MCLGKMKFASIGLFFAAFLIGQLYAADKANKANKDYHQALSKPISRAASGGCMDVYSQWVFLGFLYFPLTFKIRLSINVLK